jgi:signal transduction histidine kinase
VREICAALGARVELRSSPGVGSTFAVTVPHLAEDRPGLSLDHPIGSA